MNWLSNLLFRRDDHAKAEREIAALEVTSEMTLARVNRLLEERNRLRDAVRNTATALRAERRG